MKNFIFYAVIASFLLIMMPVLLFSQITFQRYFGGDSTDQAQTVIQTNDQGYIVTGFTKSYGAGKEDVFLLKTNEVGMLQWFKTYGGTDNDRGYTVQQTNDGGFIITGYTFSFGAGMEDFYLIKTNANGDTMWTKTYGGPGPEQSFSVTQTSDGGFALTGYTATYGAGAADAYLIKTNNTGDTLWTKTYGGANNEAAISVKETPNQHLLLSGNTNSFGLSSKGLYIVKTDQQGSLLWSKTFGGTTFNDEGFSSTTMNNQHIFAGKTANYGSGIDDIFVVKTDTNGNEIWSRAYGGTDLDASITITRGHQNNYLITGKTFSFGAGQSDVYLINIDTTGDTIWTKTYGTTGADEGVTVARTNDGGYVLVGFSDSLGFGQEDIYLVKMDSLGNTGCNEYPTSTVVSTASPTTNTPSPTTSSGSIISSTNTMSSAPSVMDDTLCITIDTTTQGLDNSNPLHLSSDIYPQPAHNILYLSIKTPYTGPVKLTLFNGVGQRLWTKKTSANIQSIRVKEWPAGLYFLKIQQAGNLLSKKILIAR